MTDLNSQRPATGLRVGISVSESDDLEKRGVTPAGINRLTVRLSRALLAEGAVLAFGHDWRNDGIMDAVCGSAVDSFGAPGIDVQAPLILNLIPWPDSPRTAEDALLRLEGILSVEEAGLPKDVAELVPRASLNPDLQRYLRSRGLTHLRRQLTRRCDARICIGGRERGYSGRYPGVFEEALFALEDDQPTFLVGLLGGITERLAKAILHGENMPSQFGSGAFSTPADGGKSLATLYASWKGEALPGDYPEDKRIDPPDAWESAHRLGTGRLNNNGLTSEENLRLLETTVDEDAIFLILRGLGRIQKSSLQNRDV